MSQVASKPVLKVLVVDDEVLIARNLQHTLIEMGNDVPEIACSGEEAIVKVRNIKPDLVFMDIRLATGMDGIEAARIIRDTFGTPIIFLTAYADEGTLSRARQVGPYGYLVKPIAERDIRIIIEVAMGRHEAELRLQESEARNRQILDTTNDAFVCMDQDGRIKDWNKQAESLFGWRRDEVVGIPLRDTIIPHEFRDLHTKGLAHFLQTGQGPMLDKRVETTALHQDGHIFPIELTISHFCNGNRFIFSAFIHDITERKKAEAALLESEKFLKRAKEQLEVMVRQRTAELEEVNAELLASNTELEQFAGVAAHDLRAPIRSMYSWVDVLDTYLSEQRDEEVDQAIDFIKRTSRKADRLISDLLEVARANAVNTRIEAVDLNRTVETVLSVIDADIANKGAEISVDRLPTVAGNPTYLEALFSNLIRNALTYSHKERPPEISIRCKTDGDVYQISVEDNGIGISDEFKHRIFEMFQRLHSDSEYPGTGIGLAFCKKVVQLCGGKIWVTSVPGKGSTFFFTYPKTEGDNK